ncbi:MAG: ankyrin repeat domain-containing protein [Planctomycetaceae bacterium]
MSSYFAWPIWDSYRSHGDVALLREDILTQPWYQPPTIVDDSVLQHAVNSCDVAAARVLIELGEHPNLPADDGFTLLHLAVDAAYEQKHSGESLEMIGLLLENGADPNVLGMDGTALHRAAGWGNVEVVGLLLKHGADIEARMLVDGELTPLMHAALWGKRDMVTFLLLSGADPMARCAEYMGGLTAEELVRNGIR